MASVKKTYIQLQGFLDTVPEELVSPICKDLLDEAQQTLCGHLFCKKCLEKARLDKMTRSVKHSSHLNPGNITSCDYFSGVTARNQYLITSPHVIAIWLAQFVKYNLPWKFRINEWWSHERHVTNLCVKCPDSVWLEGERWYSRQPSMLVWDYVMFQGVLYTCPVITCKVTSAMTAVFAHLFASSVALKVSTSSLTTAGNVLTTQLNVPINVGKYWLRGALNQIHCMYLAALPWLREVTQIDTRFSTRRTTLASDLRNYRCYFKQYQICILSCNTCHRSCQPQSVSHVCTSVIFHHTRACVSSTQPTG